jgi:hypothetical protein
VLSLPLCYQAWRSLTTCACSTQATFQVTLVSPVDRTAVSNTPVAERRVQSRRRGGRRADEKEIVWQFMPTPVMSTYLLGAVRGAGALAFL